MDNGERQLLTDIRERLGRLESNDARQEAHIEENATNIEWLISRLNHVSRRNLAIGTCGAGAIATVLVKLGTYLVDRLF